MIDLTKIYIALGGIAGIIAMVVLIGKYLYARSLNNNVKGLKEELKGIKEEMRGIRKCLEK